MNFENGSVKLTQEGDTLCTYISGEIDHHSAKHIRETIDSALTSYCPAALVMDFSAVTFMDSSGLGLVLGRYTKATNARIAFSVSGTSERVRRMFDMAGLDRLIDYKERNDKK